MRRVPSGVAMHLPLAELDPDILLGAYAEGIFPMADDDGQIMWFCPDPRAILPLDAFHVSKNLRKVCGSGKFTISLNRDFRAVIAACANRTEGTWISDTIVESYTRLHQLGFAYSVESRLEGELVGGLYGVALGGAFFGESMFHRVTDASKVALVYLVDRMNRRGFSLLDVQFTTGHLKQFGAIEIPRSEYLQRLEFTLSQSCLLAD